MANTLAILGGTPCVPRGMIKQWPPIDAEDEQSILDSLRGTDHGYGPNCHKFEEEFSRWNGNKFTVATNSGTAALHMCMYALGCGIGDEVLVPAYTWSSSATSVIHQCSIPVFVDVDWSTMNIDAERIEQAISSKTKAIVVVHLNGLSADMNAITKICRKHNLKIIEDACQAHGSEFAGRKVGTLGDCAAFSLNQNKTLSAGEGGIFVTDDATLAERARRLWSFGETRQPYESRDYHCYALGWMYRPNDLSAAFARSQLKKLDKYITTQIDNANHLTKCLQNVNGFELPTEPEFCKHTYTNYTIRIDHEAFGCPDTPVACRDRIVDAIRAEGVGDGISTWQRFILPSMTVFQAQNAFGKGHPWSSKHARGVTYDPKDFPIASSHCDRSFSINTPLRSPHNTEVAEIVAQAIRKVAANAKKLF